MLIAQQYDFGSGPLTDGGYPDAVAALIGAPVSDPFVQLLVNVLYPLTNYPPPTGVMSAPLALGALGTDLLFSCPARAMPICRSRSMCRLTLTSSTTKTRRYTQDFCRLAFHWVRITVQKFSTC